MAVDQALVAVVQPVAQVAVAPNVGLVVAHAVVVQVGAQVGAPIDGPDFGPAVVPGLDRSEALGFVGIVAAWSCKDLGLVEEDSSVGGHAAVESGLRTDGVPLLACTVGVEVVVLVQVAELAVFVGEHLLDQAGKHVSWLRLLAAASLLSQLPLPVHPLPECPSGPLDP